MIAFLEALLIVGVVVFVLVILLPLAILGLWITYRGKETDEWD